MTERISDEQVVELVAFFDVDKLNGPIGKALRELQQRRAADKYPRGHAPSCSHDVGIRPHGCTCGLYQLPEWLRGGQ